MIEASYDRVTGSLAAITNRPKLRNAKNHFLGTPCLKFYYGSKKGSVQGSLTKITEGKEVSPNSVEDVKGLLLELEKLSAYAFASGEASFLELEATVVSIVKKRFAISLRSRFS